MPRNVPRRSRNSVVDQPIDRSVISQHVQGDLPEMGDVINGQRRTLLGWIHKKDNHNGLRTGKIWCWVSRDAQPKLQVFDTEGNRAPFPGPRIDCGVANFSMVRMFHPYWCPGEHVPQGMNCEDKKNLRSLYHELIAESLQRYEDSLNSDEEDDDDDDDDVDTRKDREEVRQLYDADQSGERGSRAWKQRMANRYRRRQLSDWIRERNAAKDQRARRQRQRTTAARVTARTSTARRTNAPSARNSNHCDSTSRDSTPPSSSVRGSAVQRRFQGLAATSSRRRQKSLVSGRIRGLLDQPTKMNTPGRALTDHEYASNIITDSDDDNMGDIHHDDDQDGGDQQTMLDIFTQNAAQEASMDLPDNLNSGSSNRASIDHDDDDINSQAMFFDPPSDATSSIEDRLRRGFSEDSPILGRARSSAGTRPGAMAGSVNGGSHTWRNRSVTSQRSVKSEKVKTEADTTPINLEDYQYDEDEVMITSSRPVYLGSGSADDPLAFD